MKIKIINNYQLSPIEAPIEKVLVISKRNDVQLMSIAPEYQLCGNGVFIQQVYYDNKATDIFVELTYSNGVRIVTDITQIVIKDKFINHLPINIVIK